MKYVKFQLENSEKCLLILFYWTLTMMKIEQNTMKFDCINSKYNEIFLHTSKYNEIWLHNSK